jgi:hypothetical protein
MFTIDSVDEENFQLDSKGEEGFLLQLALISFENNER